MKKFILFITFFLLTILSSACMAQKDTSTTLSVVRSSSETFGEYYIQNLSIVLSTDSTPEFQTCAQDIVDHCVNNTFSDVQFSYDMIGYPAKVHGTVYLTKTDFAKGNVLFQFSYQIPEEDTAAHGTYDIYHNQELYQLTIYGSNFCSPNTSDTDTSLPLRPKK